MEQPMSAGDIWYRLKTPVYALILGILPIWLFAGFGNRLVVNGQLVQDDRFNVLGIILAIIGLTMAFRMLRDDRGSQYRWGPRTALGIIAALVCIAQIGLSAGLYRLDI